MIPGSQSFQAVRLGTVPQNEAFEARRNQLAKKLSGNSEYEQQVADFERRIQAKESSGHPDDQLLAGFLRVGLWNLPFLMNPERKSVPKPPSGNSFG